MSTIEIILKYRQGFVSGLFTTIQLAALVWLTGLSLGVLLGCFVDRFSKWFKPIFSILAFVLSGIPVIVLLVWAHYPLQVLMEVVIDPFITAYWVLALVNTFAVAQIVYSSLARFPSTYVTAAQVCGINARDTFRHIKLPIISREILPPILTSQVVILQATLFASLISVEEIFRVSQRINATAYKPVEIYTSLALFFLSICLPLNGFAAWFRARYTKNITDDY